MTSATAIDAVPPDDSVAARRARTRSSSRRRPQASIFCPTDPHVATVQGASRCAEPLSIYLTDSDGASVNESVVEAVARALKAAGPQGDARGALRAAFLARALTALSDVVGVLDDDALSRAAGAASDRAVLLHALEPASTAAPDRHDDPLFAARLRGIKARDQLLGAEGGTLTVGRVAEHLGISRQAVDKRRRSGKLIGLDVGRHGHAYPSWQLDERGILRGLDAVLGAMRVRDPWMQAAFFLSGDARLHGDTPLERLRRGDVDDVLMAARGYGQHGGA